MYQDKPSRRQLQRWPGFHNEGINKAFKRYRDLKNEDKTDVIYNLLPRKLLVRMDIEFQGRRVRCGKKRCPSGS